MIDSKTRGAVDLIQLLQGSPDCDDQGPVSDGETAEISLTERDPPLKRWEESLPAFHQVLNCIPKLQEDGFPKAGLTEAQDRIAHFGTNRSLFHATRKFKFEKHNLAGRERPSHCYLIPSSERWGKNVPQSKLTTGALPMKKSIVLILFFSAVSGGAPTTFAQEPARKGTVSKALEDMTANAGGPFGGLINGLRNFRDCDKKFDVSKTEDPAPMVAEVEKKLKDWEEALPRFKAVMSCNLHFRFTMIAPYNSPPSASALKGFEDMDAQVHKAMKEAQAGLSDFKAKAALYPTPQTANVDLCKGAFQEMRSTLTATRHDLYTAERRVEYAEDLVGYEEYDLRDKYKRDTARASVLYKLEQVSKMRTENKCQADYNQRLLSLRDSVTGLYKGFLRLRTHYLIPSNYNLESIYYKVDCRLGQCRN